MSESEDPEVVAARKRFESYLRDIPLPDENDPATQQAWQRFRALPEGAPVKVFRPAYLKRNGESTPAKEVIHQGVRSTGKANSGRSAP